MSRSVRWAAAAALSMALALLAAGCTASGSLAGGPSPSANTLVPPTPPATSVPTGPGSAAAAMKRLCVPGKSVNLGKPATGATPPAIAQVEQQVASVRGLRFTKPVAVEPISAAEMASRISRSAAAQFPAEFWSRRTLAWQTIGVIPPTADLRTSLLAFSKGQVVGYYDLMSHALVFIDSGGSDLTLPERFVLSHELTHAIDDQHFKISRLNPLSNACTDDTFAAALATTEGSADYFATQVIVRFPGGSVGGLGNSGVPASVPPFVTALELWPYTAGQAFIAARTADGGTAAVDTALQHWPVSTEQIIHPSLYPRDLPQPVDVTNLGPNLGPKWQDLDVMQVGEEWLQLMLRLRLPAAQAGEAAAGWGGGLYRAWTDGSRTAVLLRTTWDTPADASQFAAAMQAWIDAGPPGFAAVVPAGPSQVDAAFAGDAASLQALQAASASL